MNVNDAQKQAVKVWIEQGLKLAEVQKRLESEFALRLTYLETRLLIGDLNLVPKDAPAAQTPASNLTSPGPAKPAKPPAPGSPAKPGPAPTPPPAAGVTVSVDQVTRPGAVVSGSVTFSDGNSASWYIDQLGRLGMAAKPQGYRPSEADLREFQVALEEELAKLGMA